MSSDRVNRGTHKEWKMRRKSWSQSWLGVELKVELKVENIEKVELKIELKVEITFRSCPYLRNKICFAYKLFKFGSSCIFGQLKF